MDQLKLKLQEYYQHFRNLEKKSRKSGAAAGNRVGDMESDILSQFGLPVSKRFVQILHDFVNQSVVNDQLLDYVSRKLRTAARGYLLSPVVSDIEQLTQAKDQKKSPYDVLPELGFPAHDYAIFLTGELLYRRNMPVHEILEELKHVQLQDSWNDLVLLSKISNYSSHELYGRLKESNVRFIDDFMQHIRRKESSKPKADSKRLNPAEEGYKPNFQTLTKVTVEDIVFDDKSTICVFGKVRNGRSYTRITIGLEYSELNQLLMNCAELGTEISNYIKKRMAGRGAKSFVIDIKTQFGAVLKLDNCFLEVYKPQHKEGGVWTEDQDAFYFVEKILTKKEFEKRSKEVEVKTKIQECLEIVGGSYVYYQRMLSLGITDEEAKLRAGLQDELLFKLSFYLNKLKD